MNLLLNELAGLGTGPFFGCIALFASDPLTENMDLSPFAMSVRTGLAWSQLWQVTILAAVVGVSCGSAAADAHTWPTCSGCSWC